MTPEERQRVDELFERLAQLETAPRDPQAERAIAEGLARAPHAIYPLVQTVLVQDEALKRADARIRELSGEGEPGASGGFLDSMRTTLTGRSGQTSVPSVRAATNEPDTRWNRGGALAATGSPPAEAAPAPASGGSFLGTAAASAAGVIGGALLFNSIGSMFGHRGGSAFADVPRGGSPWDNSAAGSDLARDAGVNDIGRGAAGGDRRAGLFDSGEAGNGDGPDLDSDFGGDLGGDSGGGD
jgi:uncharacterized protein